MEANQTFLFDLCRVKLWVTLNTSVFHTDRCVHMCGYLVTKNFEALVLSSFFTLLMPGAEFIE